MSSQCRNQGYQKRWADSRLSLLSHRCRAAFYCVQTGGCCSWTQCWGSKLDIRDNIVQN